MLLANILFHVKFFNFFQNFSFDIFNFNNNKKNFSSEIVLVMTTLNWGEKETMNDWAVSAL